MTIIIKKDVHDISRHEDKGKRLLREISKSKHVTFGTDAPYKLGQIGFSQIGFASIPAVGCRVYTHSIDSIIPVVRQHIMRTIASHGLNTAAVELRLHVGIESTRRKFVDENPSSPTLGKNKMGQVARCHLEITVLPCVPEYQEKLTRIFL